jgi:U-box domain
MQELMAQAVLCVGDGHSYKQSAIAQWLRSHDTSPVTGQLLTSTDLLPNHALRQMIQTASAR